MVLLALVDVFDSALHVTSSLGEVSKSHVRICISRLVPDDSFKHLACLANTARFLMAAREIELDCDMKGLKALVLNATLGKKLDTVLVCLFVHSLGLAISIFTLHEHCYIVEQLGRHHRLAQLTMIKC